eukprot:5439538-Pyramimonas_sp.AAC.1
MQLIYIYSNQRGVGHSADSSARAIGANVRLEKTAVCHARSAVASTLVQPQSAATNRPPDPFATLS